MLKRLLRILTGNWGAKLVALLVALGLWAFVVNTGFRQEILPDPLPVTARDVPAGLAVASALPSVTVEVRAPTASFQALEPDEVRAFVNVAGLGTGTHTLEIKVVADDPNVRVLDVTPSLAEVKLEKRVTETFDVELETEGELGQGFVADDATVEPDSVDVSGAASVLADVAKVVVRLPLNGETSTVSRSLAPAALDAERNVLSGLTFNPGEIDVELKVARAEDAKEVGVEVETTGEPAEGFFVGTISVEPSTVTAQGSSKVLDELNTLTTEAVSLDGATETIETTIDLDTPPNVRAEPSQVKVKVEIRAGRTSQDVSVTPEVVNLDAGRAATVDPSSVSITLTGPADQVRQLVRDGVHLRIDASGRGPGDFTADLNESMLNLPPDVRASFSVGNVTVRIT